MQKYHYVRWCSSTGIRTLICLLFTITAFTTESFSVKEMEHQLGESIDQMESIIPVMERSKSIDLAMPYFNRYPQFTEQLIGQAVRYFPVIEKILKQYNLPDDLKYIPFFESGFREDAVSPVGATGMWQFMEGTGRKYGLTINREIDERLDFVKSTEAAARFLKSLYEELGDWALVLMAYNGGPYRVKKFIRTSNTFDVKVIMDQMPRESQNYLSKMIAAKLIFKTYKFYGLSPRLPDPINFYHLHMNHTASVDLIELSKEYKVDYSALRSANPHLKYRKIKNSSQSAINIRIPVYALENEGESVFRNRMFYISSLQELEELASDLNISPRHIALANEQFEPGVLVGKVITLPVPANKFMTLDQKFGPQPARFLQKDLDAIRNKRILSKILLPDSDIGPAIENHKIYYLKASESLLDVVQKLKISLDAIKLLNPNLDLYKSNRFYIPVKAPNSVLANAM